MLPARFREVRAIGDGAYGQVFAAVDAALGPVAVKKLKRGSGDALRRFKNEFRTVAALVHPNLIVQHELVAAGDDWLLVMELIDGDDVVRAVRAGAIALADAAAGLVDGLRALHAAGRLHCDVKPSNVLVERATGRVVLLDLGLVSAVDAPSLTRLGRIAGTPGHMSPEQAAGLPLSPASDWYAVGLLLHECLTGSPLHGTETRADTASSDDASPAATSTETESERDAPAEPGAAAERAGEGLRRLALELLAPRPEDRPSGETIAARLAELRGGAMARAPSWARTEAVGRDAELARLADALDGTARGPVLVRVRGPAGYGKTSLLDRFAAEARAAGARVLAARSYQHAQVPYKALDELVDELAAALGHHPAAISDDDRVALAHVFPVLGVHAAPTRPLSGAEAPPAGSPRRAPGDDAQEPPATVPRHALDDGAREVPVSGAEQRRRAARAFARVVAQLASERRLAIILDDLHWGDDDSLPFLIEVLRSASPVLLVAALRGDDPGAQRLPAALGEAARTIVDVDLGPLPEAATAALILAAAPTISPTAAVAAAAESQGVPLFAVELARDAAERAGAPATLDEVVRRRVAALPAPARALLAAIAVAGAPIEEHVAAAAAAARAGTTDDGGTIARSRVAALHALIAGRLVRSRAGRAGGELAIYHDRIRDRIVDDLHPDERARVHGALAHALDTGTERDAERLAFHLRGAGRPRAAVPHLIAAAERAASTLALEHAAALYGELIDIAGPLGLALARLHERRADLLAAAGHPLASADAYLTAASMLSPPPGPAPASTPRPRPDARGVAPALELRRRASEQLLQGGHFDRGLAIAEELIGVAGLVLPATPLRALPGLVASRVQLARATRRFDAAAIARRPEPTPAQRFGLDVAWTISSGLALVDPLRAAHMHGQGALRALDHGDIHRVARVLLGEASYSAMRGTASAARTATYVEAARGLARACGDPYVTALADNIDGITAVQEGRMRAGEAGCRDALRAFDLVGGAWERAISAHFRAFALTYLGDLDALRGLVTDTLADAEARGDLHLATDQRTSHQNLVWLIADGPAAARRQVERAMAAWSRGGYHAQHYYALQALVNIELHQGNGRRALALVDDGWPELRRSLLLAVQGVRIDALWLRGRARLGAAAAARGLARRRLLDAARADAARLDRTAAPWALGLAAALRARAADLAGRPDATLTATARARCAAADLRGHPAIAHFWPVPI